MHPIAFNDFADSPTLLLSLQQHPCFAASSSAHTYRYQSFVPIMPPSPPGSNPNRMTNSPLSPLTSSPPNTSRKRKAHDMSSIQTSLDENGDIDMGLPPSRTPAISPDSEFGGAIKATNTMTGQQASPPNQSGTWFRDTLKEKLQSRMEEAPDEADKEGQSAKRPCASRGEGEEHTNSLGIGWKELGTDPDLLAATRGHGRYIDKHYNLTNPEILLKNKSKEQYVVECGEGFYLFKEDLTEGRLLAQDMQTTLERLHEPEMHFDGKCPIYTTSTSAASSSSGHHENAAMDIDE